jgi:hypothetical protein
MALNNGLEAIGKEGASANSQRITDAVDRKKGVVEMFKHIGAQHKVVGRLHWSGNIGYLTKVAAQRKGEHCRMWLENIDF